MAYGNGGYIDELHDDFRKMQASKSELIKEIAGLHEVNKQAQIRMSQLAYERDRAKQERDKAEAENERLRAALEEIKNQMLWNEHDYNSSKIAEKALKGGSNETR